MILSNFKGFNAPALTAKPLFHSKQQRAPMIGSNDSCAKTYCVKTKDPAGPPDDNAMCLNNAMFTLHSFYGVERRTAAEKLSLLLQQHGVKLREAGAVLSALERIQTANVGFADAFLAAVAAEEKLPVASFDRDFDRLGASRYEPTS
jgi:hypothetical protein